MKDFSRFPRVSLGILPTPMYRLPNISRLLGKNIYIKRDDMTGVALGGNKVRKLEFLIADAMEQGCDYMLTTGGAQSNHAMLTASCCSRLGLGCILVLQKRGVWQKLGNQIINGLLGVEVRFVDSDNFADVYPEMDRICEELRQKGHKPCCVPLGGSVPLGSVGYVNAAREAIEQAKEAGVVFDDIICCAGSGGTHAGMDLGARLYSPSTRVTGIAVSPDDFKPIVAGLVNGAAELLEAEVSVTAQDINIYQCYGAGYAIPSAAGVAAVELMARQEGIILDPVYTGKTFAGLLQLAEQGYFEGRENILFLHSGGAGGLFAIDMEHTQG
ncbi:MAG: D-cysteine desulfhydrase family protein [Clostridia bacterium]|nr:D-cysteine desulfhydrase family protein [Clostridia bacterium]